MEKENMRENENINEEVSVEKEMDIEISDAEVIDETDAVDEIENAEIVDETEAVDEIENAEVVDETDAVDETENEEVVDETDAVDETENAEVIDESAEEPIEISEDAFDGENKTIEETDSYEIVELTDEEIETLARMEEKERLKKFWGIAGIAGIVIIAIAVWFFCVINGVGGKSVVNAPSAIEGVEPLNAKYENPISSLFGINNEIDGKKIVGTVNGYPISENIFQYAVDVYAVNYINSMLQNGEITDLSNIDWNMTEETTGMPLIEYIKTGALELLVSEYAFIDKGVKNGITISEEENKKIQENIKMGKEQLGENFEKYLNQMGFSNEAAYVEMMEYQSIIQAVVEDYEKDMTKYISEEELKEILNDENMVSVKHILRFSNVNEEGVVPESDEEAKAVKAAAKAKAEEILAKAKAGEDFDELIKTYNQDSGQPTTGYTFANDGSMVQEFADASFALKVGEISDIVETDYGYHIIKRIERELTVNDYVGTLRESAKIKLKKLYKNIAVKIDIEAILGGTGN